MPNDLTRLPTFAKDGSVHVVVEVPRGCGVKLKYEPAMDVFTYGRELPLGHTYPFDWGFIPGTLGEDGDPVDALVITDVPTYPGVLVPARLLGVIELEQDARRRGTRVRQRNDRVIAVARKATRWNHIADAAGLPRRIREEMEHFFLSTTFFTEKNAAVVGWKGPRRAEALIREAVPPAPPPP